MLTVAGRVPCEAGLDGKRTGEEVAPAEGGTGAGGGLADNVGEEGSACSDCTAYMSSCPSVGCKQSWVTKSEGAHRQASTCM